MSDIKHELMAYLQKHPVINTHSHHLPDQYFEGFTLDSLLKQTYVSWCGVPFDMTRESRAAYLDKVRYQSYFVWLQKSLQELYCPGEVLSPDNWDRISGMIESAYQNDTLHLDILKEKCRYEKIVLDTYWVPGCDNGHPEIFSPAFRIDPLLYGYAKDGTDHDGNSPGILYGAIPDSLSDYIDWIRGIILQKQQLGCIALKCAAAYNRDLAFDPVSKERAERVFQCNEEDPTTDDISAFQNYLVQCICETAAELKLPFQFHTGLGQLSGTRGMAMKNVIERNPETNFVLLHCSYPWTEDVSGLMHRYPNVYPDMAWLPVLSPAAAKRTLHELIEVGTIDKICWGCDTWTSEESFGALLAFRYVLADVLEEKIRDGYFTLPDAEKVIDLLMVENAAILYHFK